MKITTERGIYKVAISTLHSHIDSAVQMQKRINSAYLVFGKANAWDDDKNPPNEEKKTAELEGTIGFKKLSQFSIARPLRDDEDEESAPYPVVTYKGLKWVLVPTKEAYNEEAHWLYAEASINPDEFPLGVYRQVGVRLGVKPSKGKTALNLKPNEIKDQGKLYFYENREPLNRTSSVYVLEQFMVEV